MPVLSGIGLINLKDVNYMKQGKIAMKIFILLILSLTLTAGYAQALPSIYDFKSQSSSTPSVQDFISSMLSKMFGSSGSRDSLLPAGYSSTSISKSEAIEIAKSLWPSITLTEPIQAHRTTKGEWIVSIKGEVTVSPPGPYHGGETLPAGGIVRIDAETGEILFINHII